VRGAGNPPVESRKVHEDHGIWRLIPEMNFCLFHQSPKLCQQRNHINDTHDCVLRHFVEQSAALVTHFRSAKTVAAEVRISQLQFPQELRCVLVATGLSG
jgi:hypothetical protein